MGDDEAQGHPSRDSEHALLGVKLYPFGPKATEHDPEISYQVVRLPEFHDDVVDICLYGSPYMILKHVELTSLVRSSGVSKAKGHRDVAVHAEGCDEKSHELVGFFHLYMVVTGIGIKKG